MSRLPFGRLSAFRWGDPMSRSSWVYRPNHPEANENGMVERHLADPIRSDPKVYIISDTMDATRHMATGRVFDSKSKFRQETRASGCVEVGNDIMKAKPRVPVKLDKRERREHIQRAIYELRNR